MTNPAKLKAGIASAYNSRPGATAVMEAPAPEPIEMGLELSDVITKPLSWFRYHDENKYFREVKTPADYDDLEALIRKSGTVEPLLVLARSPTDEFGVILKGESRHIVAGRMGMERLPCRLVLSPLTLEEQQAIIWSDNLGRFRVPEDMRTWMMAKMFPGYFRGDTVSPSSHTRAEIAGRMGVSERQVKREASIAREATAKAKAEGREPTPADVKAARERKNAERRQTGAAPENPAIVRVRQVVEKLRAECDKEMMRGEGNSPMIAQAYSYAADMIEEALR